MNKKSKNQAENLREDEKDSFTKLIERKIRNLNKKLKEIQKIEES